MRLQYSYFQLVCKVSFAYLFMNKTMDASQYGLHDTHILSTRITCPMPTKKTNMWMVVYSSEKTKWTRAAKRRGLCLSDFIRMTMNAQLRIPTEDLVAKLEQKLPEQTSILDLVST